jgi:glycerol-3-phosphate dehydrogenase
MKRDLASLENQKYDLVVIGGGVYGAAIAWDAVLRGLSVALVEKDDFGAATSFNNLKTVHGGLRYLQHGDLRRMRESIRERRTLMKIAPHLVHPLAFLVPTYRELKRGRLAMNAAMVLNDLVSFDRNRLTDPQKNLPRGRVVSRAECLELAPGVREEGLTGGAIWYDAQMHNADRMTLSFILSAARAGAEVANHVEVTGLLKEGSRVVGVEARDRLEGEELQIKGEVVLNAAGPWVDNVLSFLGESFQPPLFNFSMAMNLVTRPVVNRVAVGVTCRRPHKDEDAVIGTGSRFLFMIPWRDYSMIGTSHARYDGKPEPLDVAEQDIQELLNDINESYPSAKLGREDVRLVHRGLLPMVPSLKSSSDVTLVKQYLIRDHRSGGIDGLITVIGVKYTTARDVAEKAVDKVFELSGKQAPISRSGTTPLYGGDIDRFDDFLEGAKRHNSLGLPEDQLLHLLYTYGTAYTDILSYIEKDPVWRSPITEGSPVLEAEVIHAIREEQALDLPSVVLRRTELGSAGHPGRNCLEKVAAILARELKWSESRMSSEVNGLEAIYKRRS